MVDLRLQSSVLLLSELELEFNDLLLLPEVRNQRTQLSELRVCIVCRLCVTGVCSSRGRRLLDASSVSADGLEVLVQQIVLLVEVLASDKKTEPMRWTLSPNDIPRLQIRDLLVQRLPLLLPASLGAGELSLSGLGSSTSFPGRRLTLRQLLLEVFYGLDRFSMSQNLPSVTVFGSLEIL